MRKNRLSCRSILLGVAAAALLAAGVHADDINLFTALVRTPNVLVIMDSGGTTTQTVNNDRHLLASGDDPEAKLPQEKEVLRWFFEEFPDFNYGFSYSMKDEPVQVHYLDFVYQATNVVRVEFDTGDWSTAFLRSGAQVRLGDDWDYWHGHNAQRTTVFPARYGRDGTEEFYAYESGPIVTGSKRVVSYIINDAGNQKAVATDPPFYYPAVNWTLLPQAIKDGLLTGEEGGKSWTQVSTQLGNSFLDVVYPDAGWEKALRDYVVARIQAAQYATPYYPSDLSITDARTIKIREIEQTATVSANGKTVTWANTSPSRTQITTLTYVRQFVLYDRPYYGDDTQQIDASTTLTALQWKNAGIDCNAGYMVAPGSPSNVPTPIVPIGAPGPSTPEEACPTPDQREWISSFLGPQTTPMFYIPNIPALGNLGPQVDPYQPYRPMYRNETTYGNGYGYIPWTDTVMAGGRRPLAKILNDADVYFRDLTSGDDPCQLCRPNFLVILTDGLESCASGTNVCQQGKQMMPGLVVYAIAYLPEEDPNNTARVALYQQANEQLACMTHPSSGAYIIASDEEGLRQAFEDVGHAIQERTYAFASPSVPSVELSTREKGYVSSFFAANGRPLWEGHLRAFVVDPATGTIPLAPDPSTGLLIPDVTKKLWDSADLLSTITNANIVANSTNDGRRRFFFGTDAASGVPGTREVFEVGTGSVTGTDAELWNRVFQPATPVDTTSLTAGNRDFYLKPIVDFTRGVRADDVLYRYPYDPKSDRATGKLARLGDIFHSVPAIVGRPECFQCWQQAKAGYLDYLNKNQWRRKVLFAGADDGAMHAFDAGFFECTQISGPPCTPRYDDGTGKELWAWVPNAIMPTLDPMTNGVLHQYTVDGSPTLADVYIDPVHSGTPNPDERLWRTVLLFGLREGGRTVTCLDVTQPDAYLDQTIDGQVIKDVPQPLTGNDRLPSCLAGVSSTACGNRDYPALLWEFTDNTTDTYGNHDLGQTWSKPSVAIVKVKVPDGISPDDDEERYVAIFGGGYEAQRSTADAIPTSWGGDYLYMVDIETGKTLLKLPTGIPDGYSVAGEVGILDANLDGIPERLYWTDTGGSFWRMDLTAGAATYNTSTGRVQCTWIDNDTYDCGMPATGTGGWTVKRLFQNSDSSYQPIFHRPVIVQLGTDASGTAIYGVGAGSGDREAIRQPNTTPHRFFFVRDPGGTTGLPLTLANLQEVTLMSPATTQNLLFSNGTTMTSGWYLTLEGYEKVNTPAVTIEGKVIFSTFTPSDVLTENCMRGGFARTYVLDYRNANPPPGSTARYSQFSPLIMMASEPIVYVGEDGRVHVLQSTDALALSEPIAPLAVRGNLMSWREK
jgi:Tfp pilus tip-associated adhesin PilY1